MKNTEHYYGDVVKLRKSQFSKANKSIKKAQARYKRDYDKKLHHKKVSII